MLEDLEKEIEFIVDRWIHHELKDNSNKGLVKALTTHLKKYYIRKDRIRLDEERIKEIIFDEFYPEFQKYFVYKDKIDIKRKDFYIAGISMSKLAKAISQADIVEEK